MSESKHGSSGRRRQGGGYRGKRSFFNNGGHRGRRGGRRGGRQQGQSIQGKDHAAMVMIVDSKTAAIVSKIFEEEDLKNKENVALVSVQLPLPDDNGELMKLCVNAIPAHAMNESLDKAKNEQKDFNGSQNGYVCGVGVNPNIFRWLLFKRQELNALVAASDHRTLSLLSTIELSHIKYSYPNCDFVGAISHGTVDRRRKENPMQTAIREIIEESCMVLPEGFETRWQCNLGGEEMVNFGVKMFYNENGSYWAECKTVTHVFCVLAPSDSTLRIEFDSNKVTMKGRKKRGAIIISEVEPGQSVESIEKTSVVESLTEAMQNMSTAEDAD